MAADPRKVGRMVAVRSTAATTGSTTIGSGGNGTVTVTADAAGRSLFTIRVALGVGLNVALSAVIQAGTPLRTILVTLGTDGAGALDATKNTATLVAAAVAALTGVGATASGTGATALTVAEGPKPLGGQAVRRRPARITAVGGGTDVDAEVIVHGSAAGADIETYAALPRWDRASPATTGWVR